jgi:RNA 2',3'-cyclic 3'-phosphodiesterase
MPRLFIALELPGSARDALTEISCGLPGAAWVAQEQLHLTLRFLGELDHGAFLDLRQALSAIQSPAFYLSLKGVGLFPLRGEPEVLWAGVAKSDELLRLRHKIENLLIRQGLPPDARKFYPHVTLAKLRDSHRDWVGGYIAGNSLFSLPAVPMQSFSLYSSKLTSEGAIHHLEDSYPLEGILEGEA